MEEHYSDKFTYEELVRMQNILDEWLHYDSRSDEKDKELMRKVYFLAHGKHTSGY